MRPGRDRLRVTPTPTPTREEALGLSEFGEVSPDLLSSRALLKRTDTKFTLSLARLARVMRALRPHYGLLHAGGNSIADYRTLYYDSPELRCLHDHRRGVRPRFKLRVRHYVDREVSFVEVKRKESDGRTYKQRLPSEYLEEALNCEQRRFADAALPFDAGTATPILYTNFRRITLVGYSTEERVTIDLDLRFACARGCGARAPLGASVIVEVKQARFHARSPIFLALRAVGERPASMSKYCAGALLLDPSLRMPRYARRLRQLQGASHG